MDNLTKRKTDLTAYINAKAEAQIARLNAMKSYYLSRIECADTLGKIQRLSVKITEAMSAGDIRRKDFISRGNLYEFNYREHGEHATWWSFYDEQVVRDRHWHPSPGDIVLDGGSAFGSYALPALAMGAKVICFSPASYDTGILKENVELNPELAKRCLIVCDGLHERDGWFDPDHSVFAVQPPATTDEHATSSWLRVRSLDSFLAGRPGIERVDWIKLDVEGAELGVLKGAVDTLRKYRPRLLIECHNFHVPTMETDVIDFLHGLDLGYVGAIHQHGAVSHAYFETDKR